MICCYRKPRRFCMSSSGTPLVSGTMVLTHIASDGRGFSLDVPDGRTCLDRWWGRKAGQRQRQEVHGGGRDSVYWLCGQTAQGQKIVSASSDCVNHKYSSNCPMFSPGGRLFAESQFLAAPCSYRTPAPRESARAGKWREIPAGHGFGEAAEWSGVSMSGRCPARCLRRLTCSR